jgi:hypothetical protein
MAPVSVQGLAGSCATACDAASACTAFSHHGGSGVCTLLGFTTLPRAEPIGLASKRSPTSAVRGRARMLASTLVMSARRCFAQITAADGTRGVVCMRKLNPPLTVRAAPPCECSEYPPCEYSEYPPCEYSASSTHRSRCALAPLGQSALAATGYSGFSGFRHTLKGPPVAG